MNERGEKRVALAFGGCLLLGSQGRGRVGAGIPYGTLLYSASLIRDRVEQIKQKSPFYTF